MTPKSKLFLGLALTCAAGFVDAFVFLQLGGFFASFMSGNTTQLGIGLAGLQGPYSRVFIFLPALLVALFFTGAFLGTLLVRSMGKRGGMIVMSGVVTFLLLVSFLHSLELDVTIVSAALAFSMGAQNAAVQPMGAARLGVTYVTGTLFNAAADLACSLRGEAPKWRWLQHFSVWLSMMIGGIFGGLGQYYIGELALILPAATIASITLIYAFQR